MAIRSFGNKITRGIWEGKLQKGLSPDPQRQTLKKLLILNNADDLKDLRVPPGNKLEALQGRRKGQYSIRANQQWRLCFRFHNGEAYDVEFVDYH